MTFTARVDQKSQKKLYVTITRDGVDVLEINAETVPTPRGWRVSFVTLPDAVAPGVDPAPTWGEDKQRASAYAKGKTQYVKNAQQKPHEHVAFTLADWGAIEEALTAAGAVFA